MTNINKGNIQKILDKIRIKKNDKILVYSNLLALGQYNSNLPKLIINNLKKKVGINGEIIMPTYFFKKSKKIIKPQIDKKTNGILAYYFFKREKKIFQSNSLFHSHIGYSKSFCVHARNSKYFSFGKGSDFDFFLKKKFKILSIGLNPSKFLTYLHHVEELLKVSHRKWIYISRKLVKKENTKKVRIKYYEKTRKASINVDKIFLYLIKKALKFQKWT